MGIRLTSDHRVDDLRAERDTFGFDTVFVAVGAHLAKRVDIPARDAGTMVDAVSFLRTRNDAKVRENDLRMRDTC